MWTYTARYDTGGVILAEWYEWCDTTDTYTEACLTSHGYFQFCFTILFRELWVSCWNETETKYFGHRPPRIWFQFLFYFCLNFVSLYKCDRLFRQQLNIPKITITWSRMNRVIRCQSCIGKYDLTASRVITIRCASAADVCNEVMTSQCQLSDGMMTLGSRSRPTQSSRLVDMFKRRVVKMISIFSSSSAQSCAGAFRRIIYRLFGPEGPTG